MRISRSVVLFTIVVCLALIAVPAVADTCDPADPACDPILAVASVSGTLSGATGIGSGTTSVTMEAPGTFNFFNSSGSLFTDLTITWTNAPAGTSTSPYNCPASGGNAFVDCSGPSGTSFTWHYFGTDATNLGIAAGQYFTIDMNGSSSQWTSGGSTFDITPSFDDPTGGSTSSVPEPASLMLFGTGLAALAGLLRRCAK